MPRKRKLKLPPGYARKKCKVCGIPFILGPLDPKNVEVCPAHGYTMVSEKLAPKEKKRKRGKQRG